MVLRTSKLQYNRLKIEINRASYPIILYFGGSKDHFYRFRTTKNLPKKAIKNGT